MNTQSNPENIAQSTPKNRASLRSVIDAVRARFASPTINTSNALARGADMFGRFVVFLGDAMIRGAIIAVILNIIANSFWPELPEVMPTIYGFFNGFLVVGEFLYKTAIRGISSLFDGTYSAFSASVMAEIAEMWNTFIGWVYTISF